MDLTLLSMLILLVVLLISLQLFFFTLTKSSSSKLPPGKTGWPFIGEMIDFINTGLSGVPEKFINDRIKKFSPQVFKTSLVGELSAVFCGAAGNKYLFTNENKTVRVWHPRSVYKLLPSLQQSSGTYQAAIKFRKLFPAFLKPEALGRYVRIMDNVAKQHVHTYWENNNQVTVFPLSRSYTLALGCKLLVSVDGPIQLAKLVDPFTYLSEWFMSVPINLPGTAFNRAIKAGNSIRKELHEIIQQRKLDLAQNKASPTQDILSHMLLSYDENGQPMNELEIADRILALLHGGDTASAVITLVIKYLAELPHVYNQVLEEQMEILKTKAPGDSLNWDDIQKMKYSWNVACEVMRIVPPVRGAFREAITDLTYAGFSIPKGWKLFWSPDSTHGNPEYFPEPEKFDPSRFEGNGPIPYTFVPFGGGPRMCPGQEYARIEILVFMHNVVTRFKWQKLLPHEKIVVGTMPIPANGLPIRLQPQVY